MKRLVQISDCHLLADPARDAYGINPALSLKSVLTAAMQCHPDVVLVTGDISGDDSAASYQLFQRLMEDSAGNTPWFVIPGNHDLNPHYDAQLTPRQLCAGDPLDLGSWQLHGMDTRYQGTLGFARTSELSAIEQAMTAAPDCHHMVALHHHIEPSHSWMDRHKLTNAQDVAKWITRQPRLRAAIHGHIHSQSHYQIGDCAIMSVPSTCWQWAMQPEFGVENIQPGYRELLLSEDGNWTTTIRRLP